MPAIDDNTQLLIRTKWFLRAKIAVCTFFVVILVPWYKSRRADADEECEAGKKTECAEDLHFLMFMFSPLFMYFGLTLLSAVIVMLSYNNHMKMLEGNGRQNADFQNTYGCAYRIGCGLDVFIVCYTLF